MGCLAIAHKLENYARMVIQGYCLTNSPINRVKRATLKMTVTARQSRHADASHQYTAARCTYKLVCTKKCYFAQLRGTTEQKRHWYRLVLSCLPSINQQASLRPEAAYVLLKLPQCRCMRARPRSMATRGDCCPGDLAPAKVSAWSPPGSAAGATGSH